MKSHFKFRLVELIPDIWRCCRSDVFINSLNAFLKERAALKVWLVSLNVIKRGGCCMKITRWELLNYTKPLTPHCPALQSGEIESWDVFLAYRR